MIFKLEEWHNKLNSQTESVLRKKEVNIQIAGYLHGLT